MRLPVIPVHSFEDATLNAEALQKTLTTPGATLPFLQLASAANRHVSFGLINGAAGTLSMSSGDVALVRNAVGNYTINNSKFPASFVVVATPTTSGSAFAMANVTTISAGSFTLQVLNSSTGAAVDSFVSFAAIY